MNETTDSQAQLYEKLRHILETQGIHPLLSQLNGRTPHRWTGIYRYDGPILRNVYLYDSYDPSIKQGADVKIENAYCRMVGVIREPLVFNDSTCDSRFDRLPGSPVVSYCGVPLMTSEGVPYGTLCHYDVKRCEENVNDVTTLEALATDIMAVLENAVQTA